jgi:hypothetical protein
LVVILEDEQTDKKTNFEYKMWNILTPIYDFEHENKDLLNDLINKVAQDYDCEDHIYIYGSHMGGYTAISHGILCRANAVYVHSTKLNDLVSLLNPTDSFPIFYLCDDIKSYEIESFVSTCKKYNIEFHLDFPIKSIYEVLDMYERVTSQI